MEPFIMKAFNCFVHACMLSVPNFLSGYMHALTDAGPRNLGLHVHVVVVII